MGAVEKARNTDPATSWDAAAKADLAGSQQVVLEVLAERGPGTHGDIWWHQVGVNDFKVGTLTAFSYSQSRIRTATKELVEKGLVVADGTKVNGRGRHETIWKLA